MRGAEADVHRWRHLLFDVAIIIAAVGAISTFVKLAWPRFTYWGDNAESFFPLWHIYGTSIREGNPLFFNPDAWAAASVAGEAAYGIFNPVTALNAVFISFFDDLSLASFLVMSEFLALLAVAVYFLARSYGADRAASIVVAIIMPFCGFTMFYEAGNWASGLMSITWVVFFWAAARDFAIGRRGPLFSFIAGGLAATVGNPYAVLGVVIVLFGLAIEIANRRQWRHLVGLVVMGACVGLVVLFVYMPFLSVLPQTDRPLGSMFANSNYLTPSLGDLAGVSSPSYFPRFNAWYARWDAVPSTYLSWIILPLLPWLRWRSIRRWYGLTSLVACTVVFMLFALGPDTVWLFRWPIRLLEYSFVGLLVFFALLLSEGLAKDHRRRRLVTSLIAIAVVFFVPWASKPELWKWHLLMTAITVVGVIAALWLWQRAGLSAAAWVVVLGTALVAPLQAQLFAWDRQSVTAAVDQQVPTHLQTIRDQSRDFEGTVLQVAAIHTLAGTPAVATGMLAFGHTAAAAGIETVGRYTGINFAPFAYSIGIDYRGSIGAPGELERFFSSVGPNYDVPLIQAMGVDTLVVSPTVSDFDRLGELTQGWEVIEEGELRTVLLSPWRRSGIEITPSHGLLIAGAASKGADVSFDVTSGDGTVLINRLAWLGYEATADGRSLNISTGPNGLLQVQIPPGTTHVELTYTIPGMGLGALFLLGGVLVAVFHQGVWLLTRRRKAVAATPFTTQPPAS